MVAVRRTAFRGTTIAVRRLRAIGVKTRAAAEKPHETPRGDGPCGRPAMRIGARTDDAASEPAENGPDHDRRRDVIGTLTPEEIDDLLRSETIGRIGCYGY